MGVKVQSILATGSGGNLVDIECHLSNNLPTIVIVGSANRAVGEAKERIRGAFASSLIMLPRKRITINLAPADVPKSDSSFDLPIAVAIMLAGGLINSALFEKSAFIGEIGLDGSTRAVRGIIGKLLFGRTKGIKTFFVPQDNLLQAQLIPKIIIYPVASLRQLFACLSGSEQIEPIHTGFGRLVPSDTAEAGTRPKQIQLSEIVGQAAAKRALEIAAAGGHNLFLNGPPGVGKSMLAKAIPTLLPPLEREEILEVTQLHSLASHNYDQLITTRPFRSPHHSASHISIIGGGISLRPGEISLAHRGVLFMDEFPEFSRDTLESLRQPLEERQISITRANHSAEYPSNFLLVSTANPCPCGFYGSSTKCRCTTYQIIKYQAKLSGPILDRIDLHCTVSEVNHERLLLQSPDPSSDQQIKDRILHARIIQTTRYNKPSTLNSDMTNADIKCLAKLNPAAKRLLDSAASKLKISARGYMRTVRVARTIADLETSTDVTKAHISEALAYRPQSVEA